MASIEAARALQANRPRPSAVRPIVPAIPLPYIQKRKQNSVPPKKVEEAPFSAPSSDPVPTPSSPATDVPPVVANGASGIDESPEIAPEPEPVNAATSAIEGKVEPRVDKVLGATPHESMA